MGTPQLYAYQQPHVAKLVASLLRHNVAFDGSDTGTGKTYAACAVIKIFTSAEKGRHEDDQLCGLEEKMPETKTLVMCPLSVVPAWRETLEAFGLDKVVTVINYERAWRRLGEVKKWGSGSFFKFTSNWDRFVFDEAHRCSGDKTINSKMLVAAKRQTAVTGGKILMLSATCADTPLRLNAVGFALGLHNKNDFVDFLLSHGCKPGTFGGFTWSATKNEAAMLELNRRIYEKGSRMRISEISEFPTA